MPFELRHTFVSSRFKPSRHTTGEQAFFKVSERGEFPVHFSGRLNRSASATFTQRVRVDPVDGQTPLHGGFHVVDKIIPLSLRLFTPDGGEFTATEITLADLRKFRDPHGTPSGPWSYS